MRIRRFVAATMREALAQVRAELGPDAVIISNRRGESGIELITAVDYDETLIEEALGRARPAPEQAVRELPPAAGRDAAREAGATDSTPRGRGTRARADAAEALADFEATFARETADRARAMIAGDRDRAARHAAAGGGPRASSPARPRAAPADAASPDATPAAPTRARPVAAAARGTARAAGAMRSDDDGNAPAEVPGGADRPRVVWTQDQQLLAMRREVESLRGLLENQLASLAWNDRLRREPLRAEVLTRLSELGLAADVARALAARVPPGTAATEPWRLPLALLVKHVPTVDDRLLAAGGTFAVVGPTGVGKTTTIAKLAARYALAHGPGRVALVSLDHERIGARDQLLTFARILGVPMHVAASGRELAGVLAGLAGRGLVLVDTAGMGPGDPRLPAQFATLAAAAPRLRTLLALAANAEHLALEAIVRSYGRARPEALVLTKLDEAASLGPALSVAIRHALPLAQLCDGQRVPEDLHAAPARRVWLAKRAQRLAERGRALAGIDAAYLAGHFGRVVNHG